MPTENRRQTLFAALSIVVLMGCVYLDITLELRFTEDTRNGIYERAYQDAVARSQAEGR